jgi:hypothetical protein
MPPRLAGRRLGNVTRWPRRVTDCSVASVDRSRNTDIDREADELAAAVADLNKELARA